jgi:CRISPR/Cas system-associated endoribonuclease Cas2
MHEINHLPPERMTPEQRRREVASLLANGLVRLRNATFERSVKDVPESEFVLGFTGHQSVHTDSANNRNRESQ